MSWQGDELIEIAAVNAHGWSSTRPSCPWHAGQCFCHQEQGIGSNGQRWLVTTIHNNKSVSQCYQAKATVDFAENLQPHSPLFPSKPADIFNCILAFRDLFCLWKAATLWCLKVTRSLHVDRCFMFRTFLSEVTFRTFTLPEPLRFSNGRNEEIHN